MRPTLSLIALPLALLSCGSHPGQVRLRGRLAHLEQGEFYIYSSDDGPDRMDTLRVEEGRFDLTLPLEGPATLHVVYPNLSQLTVLAAPGEDIRVEGDAQSLSEVRVTGSEDNELYTRFRLETLGQSADSAAARARRDALAHPASRVARLLLTRHILPCPAAGDKMAAEVYDSLTRACPEDAALARLGEAVRARGLLRKGRRLPPFTLRARANALTGEKARRVTLADYRGRHLLIAFWAPWKSGSQGALYRCRRLRREMRAAGKELALVSYSLDADESYLSQLEERDSVDFASVCGRRELDSPLPREWGVRDIPFFILAAPDGRILASGSDWTSDIAPEARRLTAAPAGVARGR